jgi:hypothetical protein
MAAASAPKRQITAGSGGTTDAWYARGAGVGVPLSLVVSDLCLRPGLTAGEIDVGELTDTVRGNAISRQSSALVDFRQAFTQALESTKNHDRHRSHFPPAPRKMITLKLGSVEVAPSIRRRHRVSGDGRHHREIWFAAEGRVDSI